MANDDLILATPDEPGETSPRLPGLLPELPKWRAACRPEEDCTIGGELYPAPASLGSREVLWWIDMTQIRVGAARNLLSGSMGAILGALLGSISTPSGLRSHRLGAVRSSESAHQFCW